MNCLIETCKNGATNQGYCPKHYRQYRTYGLVFETSRKDHTRICGVNDCNNKFHARGFCKKHYNQIKKHGFISESNVNFRCSVLNCSDNHHKEGLCYIHYQQYNPFKFSDVREHEQCSVEGCSSKIYSIGFCKRHYNIQWKYGYIKEPKKYPKICKVSGCNKAHEASGFCSWHYRQVKRYGHVLTGSHNQYEKNEIIDNGDGTSWMFLYDRQGRQKAKTLIDTEDVEKILNYKWCINPSNYVMGTSWFHVPLARYIMDCVDDKSIIVDHINRDTLDNRKCNLRYCTPQQNNFNKCKQSNNSSGYKGVFYSKNKGKWVASITKNKKYKKIGMFNTREEAAIAYDKAAIELFGEFAVTNF